MKQIIFATMFSIGLIPSYCARGDIVFDLEDVFVTPGQQAVVGVFVSGSGGEGLDSFDLPIEIGNDQYGLPLGITGYMVVKRNSFATIATTNSSGPPNTDPPFIKNFEAVFSDSGPTITLTSTPLRLFDLVVSTDGNFSGAKALSIFSSTDPSQLIIKGLQVQTSVNGVPATVASYSAAGTIGPGRTLSLLGGSITAVPEPSALGLFGLIVAVAGYCHRRTVPVARDFQNQSAARVGRSR